MTNHDGLFDRWTNDPVVLVMLKTAYSVGHTDGIIEAMRMIYPTPKPETAERSEDHA